VGWLREASVAGGAPYGTHYAGGVGREALALAAAWSILLRIGDAAIPPMIDGQPLPLAAVYDAVAL